MAIQKKIEIKKLNKTEVRMAEKQLLGKMHADRVYLQKLISHPVLSKHQLVPGEESPFELLHVRVSRLNYRFEDMVF